MAAAIAASLEDSSAANTSTPPQHQTELEEDEALARAVAASLQESAQKSKVSVAVIVHV